ncbi:hypothetical protein COOONC_19320 [Cooperia oncophora]
MILEVNWTPWLADNFLDAILSIIVWLHDTVTTAYSTDISLIIAKELLISSILDFLYELDSRIQNSPYRLAEVQQSNEPSPSRWIKPAGNQNDTTSFKDLHGSRKREADRSSESNAKQFRSDEGEDVESQE